jgi:hypothetical protein
VHALTASVSLRQPAASSCSVDCIELGVLNLYDCEDILRIAGRHDALVELNLSR